MSFICSITRISTLVGIVVLTGCSSVKLTAGGEAVSVADAAAISDCTRVAIVTARQGDRVVSQVAATKINEDLYAIARNEAATLNADTIVPLSFETDGAQSFTAYRCR